MCFLPRAFVAFISYDEIKVLSEAQIRPRARKLLEWNEIDVCNRVMVNYNLDKPSHRGFWYDALVLNKVCGYARHSLIICFGVAKKTTTNGIRTQDLGNQRVAQSLKNKLADVKELVKNVPCRNVWRPNRRTVLQRRKFKIWLMFLSAKRLFCDGEHRWDFPTYVFHSALHFSHMTFGSAWRCKVFLSFPLKTVKFFGFEDIKKWQFINFAPKLPYIC